MDSLIVAAARALAAGDLLGALNRVALRDDPPALALRGIVTAQLGDLERARHLLARAADAFGPQEATERARCVVALAEIALVSRELGAWDGPVAAARQVLEARGDTLNAAHARHLEVRHLVLVGRIDAAENAFAGIDPRPFPPAWRAAHELVAAGIATRRLRIGQARAALARAARAADHARVPGLSAEIEAAARHLERPAARLVSDGAARPLTLGEVEGLLASDALIVDACRHAVRVGPRVVSLASRPVLLALARRLAEFAPAEVPRDDLLRRVFRAREADESHRARLRVEAGRLRGVLQDVADVVATRGGYALRPREDRPVVVLAPPDDGDHAQVAALLADGEAWSTSALALALGASQRTVQRALETLARGGAVRAHGRGRARRWLAALPSDFTTALLLPGAMPGG